MTAVGFTYDEAVAYIEELPKFTKKHTLDHVREFLRRLGNPSSDRKIVLVQGLRKRIGVRISSGHPDGGRKAHPDSLPLLIWYPSMSGFAWTIYR